MKKKLLLTSILSVIMCMSLIVGATFALFTSQDEVDMTVTSGEVVIEAKITDTQYKTLTEDYTAFTGTKALDLGGSISVTEEGKVTFNKILPGDGIKFNIEVLNGSSVKVNYRTVITNSATSSDALFSVLSVKINNEEFNGEAVSNWDLLNVGTNGRTVEVKIELPEDVDGAEYMGQTCEFNVLVEAVQGNAPVANVNASGETKEETTLVDAMGNEAVAPAGVQLKDGANTLTLQVAKLENTEVETGNFVIEGTADAYAYNVSVPEVDPSNTKPIVITMDAPANKTGVVLFHKGVGMFEVASKDEVVNNNEFFYDPNGSITFATTGFSNFTLVAGLDGVAFVGTANQLTDALANANNTTVYLTNDILNVPVTTTAPYGNKYGVALNGMVLDGNGYTLDFNAPTGDNYGIMTTGGTIKNITITGVFRAVVLMCPTQNLYIDNAVIGDKDVCYGINTTETAPGIEELPEIYVSNSTLMAWNSIGDAVKFVSFKNCTFVQGTYYTNTYGRLVKPYVNAVFENCEFISKYYIDLSSLKEGNKVILSKCTVDGEELTIDKIVGEDVCGEGQISIELKDGSYLSSSNLADYVTISTVVYTAEELYNAFNNGDGNITLGGDINLDDLAGMFGNN